MTSSPPPAGCEVVTMRNGIVAMRDCVVGEVMHPVVGPRIEATRLYVEPSRLSARLRETNAEPLVVLDVGLGAGSNAIAAWRVSEALPANARRLEIVSFDRNPAALALASSPEHAHSFGLDGDAGTAARELLNEGRYDTSRTTWRFILGDLPATLALQRAASADIVFWDPFSPRANPELWSVAAFAALRRLCRAGATVHTYSGATATRAALLLAGFATGVGETTGENKHATMAAVDLADVTRPLDRRWLQRLRRSSAPFPADAPEGSLDLIAALPQFANAAAEAL